MFSLLLQSVLRYKLAEKLSHPSLKQVHYGISWKKNIFNYMNDYTAHISHTLHLRHRKNTSMYNRKGLNFKTIDSTVDSKTKLEIPTIKNWRKLSF